MRNPNVWSFFMTYDTIDFMMKSKYKLGFLVFSLTIMLGWLGVFLVKRGTSPDINQGDQVAKTSNGSKLEDTGKDRTEYVGIISPSATNKQSEYLNKKYGFSFIFPSSWQIGDNHLGAGTFQIFNYTPLEGKDSISGENTNKIEATIVYTREISLSDDYPSTQISTTTINIAGQDSLIIDYQLTGGQKIHSYNIPLPSAKDNFLMISIYGNESNFHVLDDIVKSIQWLK